MSVTPRKRPCPSCPYRRDVPSGLWDESEYDRLARYDGDTARQAMAGAFGVLFCHTQDGHLCGGWVGCHDMAENLAIRVHAQALDLDMDAIFAYRSPVPLFGSGAEAAAHGKRDILNPGPVARRKIEQLLRKACGSGPASATPAKRRNHGLGTVVDAAQPETDD